MGMTEPIASTPPKIGDPISMTANFTTSSGAVIAFELNWNGTQWMIDVGGQQAPAAALPEKDDKRFKIYETDWECECK